MEPRVFTNEHVPESPTWTQATIRLPFTPDDAGPLRLGNALRNALLAGRHATEHDTIVWTDAHGLSGSLHGLFQRDKRSRPTIVRLDPLLAEPRLGRRTLKRAFLRAALEPVDRLVVWAPAIIERYARTFGILREKMVALHFHHTLNGLHRGPGKRGDYIFSGGDSLRDYPTLFRAVALLPMQVIVATRWKHFDVPVPDNVTIRCVSHSGFLDLMANAYLVVFPLRMDRVRTSGQQSYLNAMALGKAVIVTDRLDAPFYIENGKTGVLTTSGNHEELRRAIQRLLDDPATVRTLGEAAQAVALPMDQEHLFSSVLRLAQETHEQRLAGELPRSFAV